MSNVKTRHVVFYQDNTQQVRIQGLQDVVTGAYMNVATVTATLLDQNGAQVPGCIGVTLAYEASSNGYYSGLVGPILAPAIGGGYVLVIEGDQGQAHLHLEVPASVETRTS